MTDDFEGLSPDAVSGLELTQTLVGTRLRLRVKPGSRKVGILGVHGGALKLGVAAPPERGKANRAVVKLLARILDLATTDVQLVTGQSSQDKTVFVPLATGEVTARLIGG
jgi:uncharacterized protein (TIGR00251 family)